MTLSLNKLKRWPTLKRHIEGRQVRIYSREWMAWWRPNAAGYTTIIENAGVYDFGDALARSHHCGPEKKIEYQIL